MCLPAEVFILLNREVTVFALRPELFFILHFLRFALQSIVTNFSGMVGLMHIG